MTPEQHLNWFAESIVWFEDIDVDKYGLDVPGCPGWKVEDVVSHLAIGLGLAYPFALATAPDAPLGAAFADVPFPDPMPTGPEARVCFVEYMNDCLSTCRHTPPTQACWTYEGPGSAGFWFRRAAIEVALHRIDAEGALGLPSTPLSAERSLDAIADAASFVLPLAASLVGAEPNAITLFHHETETSFVVGEGPSTAEVHGTADEVLAATWGRGIDRVDVTGDTDAARAWFELVPVAFAASE